MDSFNLTFQGQILPGHDMAEGKLRFGKLMGITDNERLNRFFSGQQIVLRRNVDRKIAEEFETRLAGIGLRSKIVPASDEPIETAAAAARPRKPAEDEGNRAPTATASPTAKRAREDSSEAANPKPGRAVFGEDIEGQERSDYSGQIEQNWAVSRAKKKTAKESAGATQASSNSALERAKNRKQKTKDNVLLAAKQAEEQAERQRKWEQARRVAEKERVARRAEEQRRRQKEEAAEEAEKRRREEEARRIAAEKKAAEEAEKRRQAEEARRIAAEKQAAEEAEKRRREEEEARRIAAEKKAAEEAERRRREEEEARRIAAEKQAAEEAEKRRREEEARRIAAEKQAAEEAEKRRREEEETRRIAAEKQAAEEAEKRRREEEARRIAAEKQAAEEAEKRRREEEETRRIAAEKKAAEEAERRRREEEEARRIAAEKKAAEEAEKRRQAKEARRIAAEKKAAEEAEKRRREEEEARRIAAEKKAAEEAEKRRREEEEAQRIAAEQLAAAQAEQQRLEEAARRSATQKAAAEAETRRLELEAQRNAEQLKAAEAERQRLEKEARRIAAEKRAAEKAEQQRVEEEAQRLAAAKKAVEDAEIARRLEESRRLAREKRAVENAHKLQQREEARRTQGMQNLEADSGQRRREEAKRSTAEKRLEREEARRIAEVRKAAQKARKKASALLEKQRRENQTQQHQAALAAESERQSAESVRLDAGLKATEARVRSTKPRPMPTGSRAPGAPNLYELRAFRNTPQVRNRADNAARLARICLGASVLCVLALLMLAARHVMSPVSAIPAGSSVVAADNNDQLILAASDTLLFHDRSGTATHRLAFSKLGLQSLAPQVHFFSDNAALLQARLAGTGEDPADWQLLRCTFEEPACTPFMALPAMPQPAAVAIDPRTQNVYLALAGQNLLMKVSPRGEELARASVDTGDRPVLRVRDGLLLMTSSRAPAITVLRPDDAGFGQQLDEILLLSDHAAEHGLSATTDFYWSSASWWTILRNPDSGHSAAFRFDDQWALLSRPALGSTEQPVQILPWAGKTLLKLNNRVELLRFNEEGAQEAPLVSESLQELIDTAKSSARRTDLLWRAALGILLLTAASLLLAALGNRMAAGVYARGKPRGAPPLDDKADNVAWVGPAARAPRALRNWALGYSGLAIGTLMLLLGAEVSDITLTSGLLLILGPGLLLLALYFSPAGHVGALQGQLVLVDSHKLYHLASGARIQYCDGFLMADDVLVFLGNQWLPVFDQQDIQQHIRPLASAGTRVDQKTLLVKMVRGRHPLAIGGLAMLATTLCATCLLLLMSLP